MINVLLVQIYIFRGFSIKNNEIDQKHQITLISTHRTRNSAGCPPQLSRYFCTHMNIYDAR